MDKNSVSSRILGATVSFLMTLSVGIIVDITRRRYEQNKQTTIVVNNPQVIPKKPKMELKVREEEPVEKPYQDNNFMNDFDEKEFIYDSYGNKYALSPKGIQKRIANSGGNASKKKILKRQKKALA